MPDRGDNNSGIKWLEKKNVKQNISILMTLYGIGISVGLILQYISKILSLSTEVCKSLNRLANAIHSKRIISTP